MLALDMNLGTDNNRAIHFYRLTASDTVPILISSTAQLREDEARQLMERYDRAGFAVFRLSGEEPSAGSIENLAAALDLGEAFVPPMYRNTGASATYTPSGINCLSAELGSAGLANHPAFQAANAQQLHSDGTLQPIGFVKTSILLCARPATEGGDSTIFNSVAAFVKLAQHNLEAARALTTHCLRRTQNYGDRRDSHLGPAFTVEDGEILSRYSITSTDAWDPDSDDTRASLDYASRFLADLAYPESGFFLQFRLEPQEGLIMANDKISHGRTDFRDVPGSARKMFRGLYLRRPQYKRNVNHAAHEAVSMAGMGSS